LPLSVGRTSREEILKAVADELAWEINDRILPVLKPLKDPAERICASLLCFIGMAAEDTTRGWILVRMIPVVGGPLNDRMRRHARNDIKRGVDMGRFGTTGVASMTLLPAERAVMLPAPALKSPPMVARSWCAASLCLWRYQEKLYNYGKYFGLI
jgi:hypothetical protein